MIEIILLMILIIILILILGNFPKNQRKHNNNRNIIVPPQKQTNSQSQMNLKVLDVSNNPTDYSSLYYKKEYILTSNELKFFKILKVITNKLELNLFTQVALYEIVKNKNYKDFNHIKSKTIDFVIADQNCRTLLCIELDDNTHMKENRVERDSFINKMFTDIGLKILRVRVQNYYNIEELENVIKKCLIGAHSR